MFDGGTLDDPGALRLPAEELSDWALVEPDRLADYLAARKVRRASATLRARAEGRARYLEDGRPT